MNSHLSINPGFISKVERLILQQKKGKYGGYF